MNSPSPELGETATRILTIASDWLDQNPGQQLTTRVVCALAGVTAPTLYHHFGDKDGLLQAVAERQLMSFFSASANNRKQMTRRRTCFGVGINGWSSHNNTVPLSRPFSSLT